MFSVFNNIEEYAPGFKDSIVGADILTPPDLERVFGLTGGVSAFGVVKDRDVYVLHIIINVNY